MRTSEGSTWKIFREVTPYLWGKGHEMCKALQCPGGRLLLARPDAYVILQHGQILG